MDMKKIGRKMSIMMGVTMSFCMSLIGTLMSGHFTIPGFIISFIISTVICLIIGYFVPIGQIAHNTCEKRGLERGSLGARCLESLITDVFFTPIMTLAMISYAYIMSKKHDVDMKFLPAFLSSLLIGLVICFILAFIFTPIYLKIAMKGNIPGGPPPQGVKKDGE